MEEDLHKIGFNIRSSSSKNLGNTIFENRTKNDIEPEEMKVFKYNLDYNLKNLKDVEAGANILIKHIDNRSHIVIATDYDVDGITSAVVLTKGLTKIFASSHKDITTMVNKRIHGNGFNPTLTKAIIELHRKRPIDLLISADHGSVNNDSYRQFKEAGIGDLIITDHHSVEQGIPTYADIFINPQRHDSTYLKSISGCTTAFLLLLQTYKTMFKTNNFKDLNQLLPYVGMSTIADVMSMNEPFNRHLVRLGLRELNSLHNKAWIPIKRILGINGLVTVKDIGFKIGPLINTGNAMDSEQLVYDMLIEEDPKRVEEIAKDVNDLNTMRKRITRELHKEAVKQIDTEHGITTIIDTTINVNGKVASSVGGQLNRPIVCFSEPHDDKEVYVGSGRGVINGLNILNIVNKIHSTDDSIIIQHGGHHGALGCKIHKHKYTDFKRLFDRYSEEELTRLGNDDIINIDMILPSYMINVNLYNQVMEYQPYGLNWEEPIFLTKLKIKSVFKILNFVKIVFSRKNGSDINAIYFFNDRTTLTPDNISKLRDKEVYVAYTVRLNNFRNIYNVELEVVKINLVEKGFGNE